LCLGEGDVAREGDEEAEVDSTGRMLHSTRKAV
jgi:hypothetical protein